MPDAPHNLTAEPTTATVRSRGVDLAVTASGPTDAPVLVFVHGYPDNHVVWNPLVAILEQAFRCVRYDVRGAGASSRPAGTPAYRLSLLEADLLAVIDWASPNAPVHVVGHDWGSIQSWEAVTDPHAHQRIASFTSISGPCLDHVGHWLREQWRRHPLALLAQLRKSWYVAAFQLPKLPEWTWYGYLGPRWREVAARLDGDAARAVPHNPTQAEDGAVGVDLYRANLGSRLRAPRERIARIPVQVIVPQQDPFVGPGFVRGLERWVEQLSVHSIEGGHWVIASRAEAVAELCANFIAEQVGAPQLKRNAALNNRALA